MTAEIWYLLFNEEKEILGAPDRVEVRDIAGLKKATREELENVKARDLVVWRCKEPLLSTQPRKVLQQCLSKIEFLDAEQVVELASGAKVASLGLGEDEVLLVQLPDSRSKKQKLEEETSSAKFLKARATDISAARDAPAPSDAAQIHDFIKEQSERPVMNGRPLSNHGEPIGLYHPVFNQFQEAMENTANFCADADTYVKIRELFSAFSGLYRKENIRLQAIQGLLRALLGRELTVIESNGVKSDGAIIQACGESIAYLLVQEVKNEIGTAKSDPYNQASLAYRKYWIAQEHLIDHCCCPSLILAIAGPWVCISGGVYTDKAIIQPLTDYVWLGGDPFDPNQQVFGARLFAALKSAIQSLEDYYRTLDLTRSTVSHYPYITEYGAEQTKFTYSSRLANEYRYKFVYKATLNDVSNTPIVVKFVHRYNAFAHRLLAAESLAPKLHYCSIDDNVRYGKRFMIVMDYVDLKPLSGRLTKQQYKHIKTALDILHANHMVFGDLRRPNVLAGKDTAMLIDFDWCGEAGKARYPPEINLDGSIDWHFEVGPDRPMHLYHDEHMLDNLLS